MNATGLSYFDGLYAHSADPWSMDRRWYERRKRELLLAALPRPRFGRVFEPGCGAGHLTEALAPRCAQLLATDFSADAVRLARLRLQGAPQVEIDRLHTPQQWPEGRFDLVILSEFAFYLDDADLALLQQRSLDALADDGVLLACHWRRPFAERTQDSEIIHAWFDQAPGLTRLAHHEEADFLLDVWGRQPQSVAQREGFA
ncbi:methyltransferase [Noviherbaspirillum sp. 1P10PC]|uniref:class I SAM-dependent methyltransferase n=1 Tax=Noviherbaspirillum sp. 1P10PC TaxID=3132292 RepID=UPI0039A0231B